ncbi:extracellular solute-binding protein [Mycetocola manganoxydans]|uniref:Extracellular solute-binding protein n=1 Tax=Mycetocola manganoxydans TaxID=699879 RepID=A0A3L6ZW08_9MICO|nr:extracellular solute-binding protein [Mycetocola manganoxydans]RLP71761.1 extracellular solute-binding protein [Mycetocola manganoxydans]GHD39448.1 sugar ABC transporter substrate-binding protein [Mycetocola manganoxydans]
METKATPSRRTFISLAIAAPLLTWGLTSCGTTGPGGAAAAGTASMWALSGDPNETIRKNSVDAFNKKNPDAKLSVTFFQNDAYKTKIKTAIGAGQAPTMIYGWGGGTLKSYADAGQVDDLTSWLEENPDVKDRLFAGAFGAATIDGKIFAIPIQAVQPIVFYYNKELFEQAKVEPPETWSDVMSLVQTFNDRGVAPFSLGGQSRWTSMMWLQYMFDRVGGPEVFTDIFNGKADAWSHPAAIEALTKIQELVKANGFIKGFNTITADSNADQALLYTGKAAMMLHGSWTYGGMKNDGAGFVQDGKLGWVPFPTVEGGVGDPKNAVGNPCNYLSISSKASDEEKATAKKYFTESLSNDEEVAAFIETGAVPVVNGIEDQIKETPDSDFLGHVYELGANAPAFQQSWDQALNPTAAEALLNNIDQLFVLSITPEQFASNMNETLGT